jgi:hypothetical protein
MRVTMNKRLPSKSAGKRSRRLASKPRDGIAAPYAAYAIASDGTRRPVDAITIVIDLGTTKLEIDLTAPPPVLAAQLRVAARGERLLVVGHGDGGSVYLGCIVPRERPWKPK